MKFDCGLTAWEKYSLRLKWHDWFAWYPVRVGSCDCRWWEVIERKITSSYVMGAYWEYRVK